uniref:Uncharacterized protein n=1 Tax=Anguilla anguilla TaxID=7936 RepID=A0A0E9PFU3_ANGAN
MWCHHCRMLYMIDICPALAVSVHLYLIHDFYIRFFILV